MDEKIERTEQDKEKFSAGNDTPPAQEQEAPVQETEASGTPPQADAPAQEVKEEDAAAERSSPPETPERKRHSRPMLRRIRRWNLPSP